jgi:hypothetical protein
MLNCQSDNKVTGWPLCSTQQHNAECGWGSVELAGFGGIPRTGSLLQSYAGDTQKVG